MFVLVCFLETGNPVRFGQMQFSQRRAVCCPRVLESIIEILIWEQNWGPDWVKSQILQLEKIKSELKSKTWIKSCRNISPTDVNWYRRQADRMCGSSYYSKLYERTSSEMSSMIPEKIRNKQQQQHEHCNGRKNCLKIKGERNKRLESWKKLSEQLHAKQ